MLNFLIIPSADLVKATKFMVSALPNERIYNIEIYLALLIIQ